MEDIRKSINSILYERATSPFYGTLIISELLWNWKIIYVTLFVPEDVIKINKIDFIISNYSDYRYLMIYPILSTIILLTIVPFFSNGAYWLSLKFNKWKNDQKNRIEKKQLLSIEQSIELRELVSEQEARFEQLLGNKNSEIEQLKAIIEKNKEIINNTIPKNIENKEQYVDDDELGSLLRNISNDTNYSNEYERALRRIQAGRKLTGNEDQIDSKLLSLLESYNIILPKGLGLYELTNTGKKFNRMLNQFTK